MKCHLRFFQWFLRCRRERIFVQLIIFHALSSVFVSSCLLKSWGNSYDVSWSLSVKSSTVGCLSQYCCHCASKFLRRNFEHSCDQVTFRMALRSNYYNSAEVVLIQVSFLTVSSKQKNKNEHTEYHDIFISFKSHVYSKDGSPICSQNLVLYLCVWVKVKFFYDNSNLTNLVDIQSLHENDK